MKNQPKIAVPVSNTERILDAAALLFSGLALLVAASQYGQLPEQIPSHFNAAGAVDSFSAKYTIFFLPVLAVVLALGIIYLAQFPHKFNHLNKITPENAGYEYQKSRFLLRGINVLTSLLLFLITMAVIQSAQGESTQLFHVLFWIVVIALFVGPVVFYWLWPKQEHNRD